MEQTEIQKAKEVLRNAGYFVDNLWHVDDVSSKFEGLTFEQKQELLNGTLTNEWIMEQIWEAMCTLGTDYYEYTMIKD